MGFNRANFVKIKQEYETKHIKAKEEATERTLELYTTLPELKQIDDILADIGLKLFNEAIQKKDDYNERVLAMQKEHEDTLNSRKELLKYHDYPENYTDVKYECAMCNDTGYIDIKMCLCMKKALIEAGYASSGIGHLIKKQSFDTFNLDYYKHDANLYKKMESFYIRCKNYAKTFNTDKVSNMMFIGGTGLGKTHLSTSIAKVVIERGYDVVYEAAQNIFEDFQFERFSRTSQDVSDKRTDKYFDCDLLIIDDLGTEVVNQFTISCLYNLLNTRINKEKSIILNTNFNKNDLRKAYADRITSRLFGEFVTLLFEGTDIRELKLRMK